MADWTDCDEAGKCVKSKAPRHLGSIPDNMDETVLSPTRHLTGCLCDKHHKKKNPSGLANHAHSFVYMICNSLGK